MVAASNVWTIYCHIHTDSGRRYIGLTKKTMMKRWNRHVFEAKHVKKGYGYFHNAIRKYGPESFSHEILEKHCSLEAANLAEQKWIKHFRSNESEFGFNIARGGSHTPHPIKNPWDRPGFREKHPSTIHNCLTPQARAAQLVSLNTPDSKAKRSAATKAAMARPDVQAKRKVFQEDPEYRARIANTLKESLVSPEARARLSRASRESATLEVRKARGESIKLAYQDPEVKERHRIANTEAQNRPEVKAKHAARVTSDETRAKISAASTGFRHTDESKAAMRQQFGERRERLLRESGCSTWSQYIRLSIKKTTQNV